MARSCCSSLASWRRDTRRRPSSARCSIASIEAWRPARRPLDHPSVTRPGSPEEQAETSMAQVKAFKVDWHAEAVGEVLEKVRAYPWPIEPEVADGWLYGFDGKFLRTLCAHWLDGYDWRAAEADLNRFPQFTARIEDFDIHFVHVVGEAGGQRPLSLSHGWAGSHYAVWGAKKKLGFPS